MRGMKIDWDKEFEQGRDYSPLSTQQIDRLLQYASPTKGSYLDIACGTGQLTREMFHRGYKNIIGIDTSAAALTIARTATTQPISYLESNLEEDFTHQLDTTFDLITCKDSIAFIEDLDTFLGRVASLLSPDGIFIVATPRIEAFPDKQHITIESGTLQKSLQKHFTLRAHYIEGGRREIYILSAT